MDPVRAAVLVPISSDERGATTLTLIVRASGLERHGGQVAFPGGRYEPQRDESLLAAALREAEEEVGLRGSEIEVLGALPECRTLTSNFLISPFVARIPANLSFRPDPVEVAEIFTAPLAAFRPDRPRDRFVWERGAGRLEVPCVRIGGRVVWGATLRIVEELVRRQHEFGLRFVDCESSRNW